MDVRKFFDTVRWDLIVKAVEAHTDARWVVLYVKRWLAADVQQPDGVLLKRDRGTPQGSPYEQRWFMRSARRLPRVGAVVTTKRCA